jgi:hypothetical protein
VTDEKPRIQGRMNSRPLEYLTSWLLEFKSSLKARAAVRCLCHANPS